jgi:hypothetical protein
MKFRHKSRFMTIFHWSMTKITVIDRHIFCSDRNIDFVLIHSISLSKFSRGRVPPRSCRICYQKIRLHIPLRKRDVLWHSQTIVNSLLQNSMDKNKDPTKLIIACKFKLFWQKNYNCMHCLGGILVCDTQFNGNYRICGFYGSVWHSCSFKNCLAQYSLLWYFMELGLGLHSHCLCKSFRFEVRLKMDI